MDPRNGSQERRKGGKSFGGELALSVERLEGAGRSEVTQLVDDVRIHALIFLAEHAQRIDALASVFARGGVHGEVDERFRQADPIRRDRPGKQFMQSLADARYRSFMFVLAPPDTVVVLGDGSHDDTEQRTQPTVARDQALNLRSRQVVGARDRLFEDEFAGVPDEQSEELCRDDGMQPFGIEANEHHQTVDRGLHPQNRLRRLFRLRSVAVPRDLGSLSAQREDGLFDVITSPRVPRQLQRARERIIRAHKHRLQPVARTVNGVDRS